MAAEFQDVDDRVDPAFRWRYVGMDEVRVGDRDHRPPAARMVGRAPDVVFGRRRFVPAVVVRDVGQRARLDADDAVVSARPVRGGAAGRDMRVPAARLAGVVREQRWHQRVPPDDPRLKR